MFRIISRKRLEAIEFSRDLKEAELIRLEDENRSLVNEIRKLWKQKRGNGGSLQYGDYDTIPLPQEHKF